MTKDAFSPEVKWGMESGKYTQTALVCACIIILNSVYVIYSGHYYSP